MHLFGTRMVESTVSIRDLAPTGEVGGDPHNRLAEPIGHGDTSEQDLDFNVQPQAGPPAELLQVESNNVESNNSKPLQEQNNVELIEPESSGPRRSTRITKPVKRLITEV